MPGRSSQIPRKAWTHLAAVTLVVGASLTTAGCAQKRPADQLVQAAEGLPPQVSLYGVRLRSWQAEELVAQGRAAKLTYDRQSTRFTASEGMVQLLRGPAGEDALEVRAPVVEGEMAQKQARGSGGVTVRADNGLEGQTPSASFDGVGMVARGEEAVQAQGPGYALTAGGFTFYFLTDELHFEGPVTSRIGEPQ